MYGERSRKGRRPKDTDFQWQYRELCRANLNESNQDLSRPACVTLARSRLPCIRNTMYLFNVFTLQPLNYKDRLGVLWPAPPPPTLLRRSQVMTLCQFFRRLFCCGDATDGTQSPAKKEGNRGTSNNAEWKHAAPQREAQPPADTRARDARTTRNVLKLALTTLGAVTSPLPFGGVLSSVIDPPLAITDRIEVR